ncbi:MAG: SDR family oxidoreductase [Hyphomonas sp.]|uniref:SDR family NAD(P)-dependent oxidoreductase n=1 Tax=Hyphomonas sp. TaxID=87 RepID=UPI0034A01947
MKPVSELEGKVCLVTGASRGIGKAIAHLLDAGGASVIAVARPSEALDALAEEMSERTTLIGADATSDAFLEQIDGLHRLDVLINNLGTNVPRLMEDVDDGLLDLMINLNIRSTYRISRSAVRRMSQDGRVINITSQMGHVGSARRTVYCMTKHAIEGLTKAMAIELAPRGIRVNSVAPTFVETEMTKPMLADPEFADFVKRMIPLGRLADAEDVARAVAFLCGPGAKMITGQSLIVDGGWTAQ